MTTPLPPSPMRPQLNRTIPSIEAALLRQHSELMAMHRWLRDAKSELQDALKVQNPLAHAGDTVGFYGATPVSKPTVSGIRDSNAALADLLTELETMGLLTDTTTAS